MTRPLRLQYPGALYHVTARGDHREAIYRDARDREAWLSTLGLICKRFNFVVHAYCQMTNHYHLLLETVEANLSLGMRQLNGLYTQSFNRRHRLAGHLFQGRYKAILVQQERYLLKLTRYVVLNPVRAGMVSSADEWAWSSHPFFAGIVPAPPWLETGWLLGQFGSEKEEARRAYANYIHEGIGKESPLKETRHQLILGDEAFVEGCRRFRDGCVLRDAPKAHRRAVALPLAEYQRCAASKTQAMALAYYSTAYTMEQIADHFGVSARTVSRAILRHESEQDGSKAS